MINLKFRNSIAVLCVVLTLSACATTRTKPVTGYTSAIGEKAAKTALAMLGQPYKSRGETPAGFDCSGLVRYSYLVAGLDVPHGTEQLRSVTNQVSLKNLRKGDLLFFDENGKKYSHVGIYIGSNLFVHAPSSGKKVRKDSLKDQYWKKSFLEARRFS